MGQKVQIILTDDLDGGEANETVTFGLDGKTYEIDLSTANADSLRESLSPYVSKGRPQSGSSRRGGGRRSGSTSRSADSGSASANDIRAWAREQGKEVSERGRVPAKLRQEYEAAHA